MYLLISLIVLLFSTACATNPVTGRTELMLVSEAQEIEMGREAYPSALWAAEGGGGEYRDEKAKAYLGSVIREIHSVSHRPNLPVSFAIQNSTVPNAWAIPGHVTITRGLLSSLDNEAEFAFVMGHEMGHVSARHSARQTSYGLLQQLGLVVLGVSLQDSSYSDLVVGLGAIGSGMVLLKFSRDDELEADRLDVDYMSGLGYDPGYGMAAHRNLEIAVDKYMKSLGKGSRESSLFEELLSTHPRTKVRIEEIDHLIRQLPPRHVRRGDNREKFEQMTSDLRRVNKIYAEHYDPAVMAFEKDDLENAEKHLREALSAAPDQAPFRALEGFILMKRKNYDAADRAFNEALALDRDYQPAVRGQGMLSFQNKNYGDSIGRLRRALALYPDDALSHYYLGMGYYKTDDFREAIPYLGAYAEARPDHKEVHGTLGICYEKTGNYEYAYKEYREQVKVAPDGEMGQYAAKRAVAIKPKIEGGKK